MSAQENKPREPFVANIVDIQWKEYPGHFGGALSKPLVRPETCASERLDFRISTYHPGAYVREHAHQVQEQIYYVMEGEGVLTLDGRRVTLRKNDYVFVPPGVRHSFHNEGTGFLTFQVITSPTSDTDPEPAM